MDIKILLEMFSGGDIAFHCPLYLNVYVVVYIVCLYNFKDQPFSFSLRFKFLFDSVEVCFQLPPQQEDLAHCLCINIKLTHLHSCRVLH